MIIDFTAPGEIRVINENGITWREFNDLVDLLDREASINLWPILIESAIILVSFLLLGLIARYIVETALIRMVNETEETGRYLGIWEGVRRGFSFRAGKLFLLELVVCLLVAIISIAIFGLAILPLLLVISGQKAIPITIGVVTFMGMLILAFFLWLAAIAVLSLVLQVIRRACVLEKQSLLDSIRQGILLTKHHLKDVAPLWLVWMGLRLIWVFLIVPVLILFIPFLLLTIPLGALLGGGPAALVAGITALLVGEETAETSSLCGYIMPGGDTLPRTGLIYTASGMCYVRPNGIVDGRGVIPDMIVKTTINDRITGNDPVLDATLKMIRDGQ